MRVPEEPGELLAAVIPGNSEFATNCCITTSNTSASNSQEFMLQNHLSLMARPDFREIACQEFHGPLGPVSWIAFVLNFDGDTAVATVQYFLIIKSRAILATFAVLETELADSLPTFHQIVVSLRVSETISSKIAGLLPKALRKRSR